MNSKSVVILLAVSACSGLLITGAIVYLWSTHPETLGMERPVVATPLGPHANDSLHQASEAEALRQKNERLNTEVSRLRDSLKSAYAAMHSSSERVRQLDESLSATHREHAKEELQRKDSTRLKNIRIAAEMYEKGQPAEIAKILAESEPEYVVDVLTFMKRKNAAQILERMPTEKAVRVSKMLVRR
jgi:flagellar motility protein MotE (MotC chaperone)